MSDPITVRDIVRNYLGRYCYDGLFNADAECACPLDDLMPCDCESIEYCEAGHLAKCAEGDQCETCADGGMHVKEGSET